AVGRGIAQEYCDVAAPHELAHDVRLAMLLADVVHGDDVGMVAEACHRLRLAADAATTGVIEAFGLDERDGDVTVEAAVVPQVDALLAALAEHMAQDVAAVCQGWRRVGHRGFRQTPSGFSRHVL